MTALLRLTNLIVIRVRSMSERGAVASEYALIASLIAVAIVAGVTAFGISMSDRWDMIVSSIP